eukprot:755411-Hanusia_phi.AAC.6
MTSSHRSYTHRSHDPQRSIRSTFQTFARAPRNFLERLEKHVKLEQWMPHAQREVQNKISKSLCNSFQLLRLVLPLRGTRDFTDKIFATYTDGKRLRSFDRITQKPRGGREWEFIVNTLSAQQNFTMPYVTVGCIAVPPCSVSLAQYSRPIVILLALASCPSRACPTCASARLSSSVHP